MTAAFLLIGGLLVVGLLLMLLTRGLRAWSGGIDKTAAAINRHTDSMAPRWRRRFYLFALVVGAIALLLFVLLERQPA